MAVDSVASVPVLHHAHKLLEMLLAGKAEVFHLDLIFWQRHMHCSGHNAGLNAESARK